MEAINKSHKGCKLILQYKCRMTEPGQKGRVSFTRLTWRDYTYDKQVALGQFDVGDESKILEMDFKVDSHDGMIWFKYD